MHYTLYIIYLVYYGFIPMGDAWLVGYMVNIRFYVKFSMGQTANVRKRRHFHKINIILLCYYNNKYRKEYEYNY